MNGKIKDLLNNCEYRLNGIISKLGWTKETILALKSDIFICKSHTQPDNFESKDDPYFPQSFECKQSVVITKNIINELLQNDKEVPNRFSELQTNFNCDEKLKLYEYVIAHTHFSKSEFLSMDTKQSFAEILAHEKKEFKRVRKFRTSKPTHIEEVRSLIDVQMEALKQYLHPKNITEKVNKELKKAKTSSHHSKKRRRSCSLGLENFNKKRHT